MRIGVLGTGTVGQTLGTRLVGLGHDVTMGSRTGGTSAALAWVDSVRDGGASSGAQGAAGEVGTGTAAEGTFADAAAAGRLVVNATSGTGSLDALGMAREENLAGKVLLDVSNPLDFSRGFPPVLAVSNTTSLAEQLQAAFPSVRVVKALNTMTASVMVEPGLVPGRHTVFVSGESAEAKAEVTALLVSFGWPEQDVLDLGGIETARGTEMYLPLWVRLLSATGTPLFNVHVAR